MAERRDPLFLIIAGAITALFLPFAIAFPPTFIAKLAAIAALLLVAAGMSALILKLRKKSGSGTN
jgi:predicted benzoate:H+ symporter BenE